MRLHVVVESEKSGELHLGPRHEFERRLGGDAERALVSSEELLQLQPSRGFPEFPSTTVADLDDLARRQYDLHRHHEVARVSVASVEERKAARPNPPADERARIRGGVVGIEDAVALELLV